jgi:hypothetical protein
VPYDSAPLSPEETLRMAMSDIGLRPPPLRYLAEHKAEQERLHPAGWLYRHNVAVQVGRAYLLLCGVLGLGLIGCFGHLDAGIVMLSSMITIVAVSLVAPVRGPAAWREREIHDLRRVHPDIRKAALDLKQRLPNATYYLGELYHEHTRLDPYLVVEFRNARAVVGIWDGEQVIARA